MKHQLMEPSDPHSCRAKDDVPGSCWLCDGGLACCKVCGLAESQLDDNPECSGVCNDQSS